MSRSSRPSSPTPTLFQTTQIMHQVRIKTPKSVTPEDLAAFKKRVHEFLTVDRFEGLLSVNIVENTSEIELEIADGYNLQIDMIFTSQTAINAYLQSEIHRRAVEYFQGLGVLKEDFGNVKPLDYARAPTPRSFYHAVEELLRQLDQTHESQTHSAGLPGSQPHDDFDHSDAVADLEAAVIQLEAFIDSREASGITTNAPGYFFKNIRKTISGGGITTDKLLLQKAACEARIRDLGTRATAR